MAPFLRLTSASVWSFSLGVQVVSKCCGALFERASRARSAGGQARATGEVTPKPNGGDQHWHAIEAQPSRQLYGDRSLSIGWKLCQATRSAYSPFESMAPAKVRA